MSTSKKLKPLSLRVNFSWTLIGNMLYAFAQWGILIIIARLGSEALVGQFALGLAISAPVFMFTNLELQTILASDVKFKRSFNDYFSLRFNMSLIAVVIIILISMCSDYRDETIIVIILIAFAKFIEAISDILFGFVQQQERMNIIGKSKIGKSIFSIAFFAVGLILTGNNIGATIGLIIAWGSLLVLYDLPQTYKLLKQYYPQTNTIFIPSLHLIEFRSLIIFTLPLGFTRLIQSLIQTTPRYFTESILGEAQLGVFVALTYIIFASNRVVISLSQALIPRLSIYFQNQDYDAFMKLLMKFLAICIVFGALGVVGSVLFGNLLLTIIYGSEYSKYSDLFTLMMMAGAFSYLVTACQYLMTITGTLKIQLLVALIIFAVVILSSYILIPLYALAGATIVILWSNIIYMILSIIIVIYILRRFNKPKSDID